MKAEELMIGDWVNYRPGWINEETGKPEYECGDVFPVKITCIYDGLAQYDDVLPDGTINTIEVADYELSGIPLTPKILEKNGFERGYDNKFSYGRGMYVMMWSKEHYSVGQIHGSWGAFVEFAEIRFVHELQHCLKVVGIDKEIIL